MVVWLGEVCSTDLQRRSLARTHSYNTRPSPERVHEKNNQETQYKMFQTYPNKWCRSAVQVRLHAAKTVGRRPCGASEGRRERRKGEGWRRAR